MRLLRYGWMVWVVAAACSHDKGGANSDLAGADLAGSDGGGTTTNRFTMRGSTSGLSQGRSTGGPFAVSGTVGVPQPRVVSSGGMFAMQPLVP